MLQIFHRDIVTVDGDRWPDLPPSVTLYNGQQSDGYLMIRGQSRNGVLFCSNPLVARHRRWSTAWISLWHVAKHATHPTNHVFAVRAHNVTLPSGQSVEQVKADYRNTWTHWRLDGIDPDGNTFTGSVFDLADFGLTGADVPSGVSPGRPWTPGQWTITRAALTLPSLFAGLDPSEVEAPAGPRLSAGRGASARTTTPNRLR